MLLYGVSQDKRMNILGKKKNLKYFFNMIKQNYNIPKIHIKWEKKRLTLLHCPRENHEKLKNRISKCI